MYKTYTCLFLCILSTTPLLYNIKKIFISIIYLYHTYKICIYYILYIKYILFLLCIDIYIYIYTFNLKLLPISSRVLNICST